MTRIQLLRDCSLQRAASSKRPAGSILLLVLVAIVIMSLTTSSYLLLMRNEHMAARYSGNRLQARLLAESGLDYLRLFLNQSPSDIELQGGLHSNAAVLQDVLVVDDSLSSYRGRFTVIAPDMVQGYYQGIRHGLENESAKLNLNSLLVDDPSSDSFSTDSSSSSATAGSGSDSQQQIIEPRDRLLLLPGMTDEIADAILDWMDADDDTRSYGAEADYYLSLARPYRPANRPFRNLDELLMVRGVTRELLYGPDVNRNYQIDAQEQLSSGVEQLEDTSGQLNFGWSAYLTTVSAEANVTPDGEAKVDVNGDDLETLHGELLELLGSAEANFIVAFRQFGAADSSFTGATTTAESVELDFDQPAEQTIDSLLDLVDAKVTITDDRGRQTDTLESPWTSDGGTLRLGFAELLDVVASDTSERIAGRININLASRPVLLTVPGMTEILADQILASREVIIDRVSGEQRHPTWLVADELIPLEEFKPMYPYLTTAGDVFSCQIAGFFDDGTARARIFAVLARSAEQTQLLQWEDLQGLGPGFSRAVVSTVLEVEQ